MTDTFKMFFAYNIIILHASRLFRFAEKLFRFIYFTVYLGLRKRGEAVNQAGICCVMNQFIY